MDEPLKDLEDGELPPCLSSKKNCDEQISPASVSNTLDEPLRGADDVESSQRDNEDHEEPVHVELFVGDLSFFCVENDLVALFAPFGSVLDVRIRRSDNRGHSLMYGFVKMESLAQAEAAAVALNEKLHKGRTLRVQVCTLDGASMAKLPRPGTHVHVTFVSDTDKRNLVNEEKLRRLFEPFGDISDVIVKRHTMSENPARQNGYGFVYFYQRNAAEVAVKELHEATVEEVRLECELSHRSVSESPSPLAPHGAPPPAPLVLASPPGAPCGAPGAGSARFAAASRSALKASLSLRSLAEGGAAQRRPSNGATGFGGGGFGERERDRELSLSSANAPPQSPHQSPACAYRLPPAYPQLTQHTQHTQLPHTMPAHFASPPQQSAPHMVMVPLQQSHAMLSPRTHTHSHTQLAHTMPAHNVFWGGAPGAAPGAPGGAQYGLYGAPPGADWRSHNAFASPELPSGAFPAQSAQGLALPSYGPPAFYSLFAPPAPGPAQGGAMGGAAGGAAGAGGGAKLSLGVAPSPLQHQRPALYGAPLSLSPGGAYGEMSPFSPGAAQRAPQFFSAGAPQSDPFGPPFYPQSYNSPRGMHG